MGKEIFSDFAAGKEISDELKEKCQGIVEAKELVDELKKKILVLKNIKVCPNCKTEMELEIAFCPKCGTKQEKIQKPEPEVQEE